ncbi:MAG: metallopeptidase family protein [Bifidobacteriaceae bacterium]|jgi:predicted Zn-dependent protease with MMP-like domain|nr:metallopeptidase family protein [Bifidobacteriaceae bacterium]
MAMEMSPEQFEWCVGQALDLLPPEVSAQLDNVAVIVQDLPPPGEPPDLLGFYDGVPLTERFGFGGIGALPDRILIFREPILAICETPGDVVDEVVVTVVHEVAHYFGIDEERIHELGWG